RSHASCTASSASAVEPRMRVATARRWPRRASNAADKSWWPAPVVSSFVLEVPWSLEGPPSFVAEVPSIVVTFLCRDPSSPCRARTGEVTWKGHDREYSIVDHRRRAGHHLCGRWCRPDPVAEGQVSRPAWKQSA